MNEMKIEIGGRTLDLATPAVMTILNVTPDSFFEGSRRFSAGLIEEGVRKAVEEGTSIIDVGGYSSRPGADDVSPAEEYERVARGVEAVRKAAPGMVVSVDTFRSGVARRVLEEFGPCIVNDISAGELDPQIVPLTAQYGVPYIAMHMRATPATMQRHTEYADVVTAVEDFFEAKTAQLAEAGVRQVILDPGFGFAKTTAQNYLLLGALRRFARFGVPVLAGISRKSMIYKVLDTTPAESLYGTTALHWECLRGGASILRVHDTRAARDVIRLFNYYNECHGDETHD